MASMNNFLESNNWPTYNDLSSTILDEEKFNVGRELIMACLCNSKKKTRACLRGQVFQEEPEFENIVRVVFSISLELNHNKAAEALIEPLKQTLGRYNLIRACMMHQNWSLALYLVKEDSTLPEIHKKVQDQGHKVFFDILQLATTSRGGYSWEQIVVIKMLTRLANNFDYPADRKKGEEDPLTQAMLASSHQVVGLLLEMGVTPANEHAIAAEESVEYAKAIQSMIQLRMPKKRKREDKRSLREESRGTSRKHTRI